MASVTQQNCQTVLLTSLALIDQFQNSLLTPGIGESTSNAPEDYPSPLLLLKAASESLKSTITKVSLLSITPPFTESAVISILKPMNDAILPSLVTAVLLVTSTSFPESFSIESNRLAIASLSETRSFLELIEKRAKDGKPKSELDKKDKQAVTEATGRAWEICDSLINFCNDGVPGFIVKKVDQWLDLMKDAVQELQEWDPEEEDDDIFGDASSDDGDVAPDSADTKNEEEAKLAADMKDQVLKVLTRIPQSIHVVVKQRLTKLPPALISDGRRLEQKHIEVINKIVKHARTVSELIDESAEALYMANPKLCSKKAGEARALTIEIVESVVPPWQSAAQDSEPTKEDTYIKRALLWIEQVDIKFSSNGKVS